ncbi:ABC transporter ATP-binding protein [Terribacillus sp. AE2B 122]|uniref:ABC transporter ATP-binding protein n=1 Tax=Terribacillus sp. AE2B 122 TaxID=1331902 RepID=UPI0014403F75|nr:ABC transporter ATP-binding protein [Terribacillus sp. AE2B 122]VVM35410.1 Maltose/maltodextrin transport ATP-binding protein MalK (EC 3.6.3.19); Multiple sugar ABC transporter2C ATP-binding protein [Terribacillus sp. AE2B 122]
MDIHLHQLSMVFDNTTAVQEMTTTIKDGELVSLLGPSGCGKSTTLMLLSGLYKPTSGSIHFGDQDVTKLDAEKRGIGMVFQSYALYPHLSVLKNIMFPLRMKKVPKKEAEARAKEMAELVQIGHLLDRKPGQLSGGQQQRVAIARALVKKPNVLLLDEPLSNLDARLRLEMREEIRRIQQEIGITAIFVTHDQEEALSISDRVMLMKDGIIQQESAPQNMYKKPENEFVASFLGNPPINLMTLTKTQESTFYRLADSKEIIQLPALPPEDMETVRLGIRAEDLFHTTENPLFQGEIIHIETIGRDTLIRMQVGSITVRALVDPEQQLQIGDAYSLGVRPGNIHYFHPESGKRLPLQMRGGNWHAKANVEEHA